MLRTRILFVLLLAAAACDRNEESGGIKYLNEVIDIMEEHSINRNTIDWSKFREDVMASAGGADNDEEINRALRTALMELADNHSFVSRGSGDFVSAWNHTGCTSNFSGNVDKPDNIGYINVPGYSGNDPQFAINIQKSIQSQDSEDLIGWIVDLRGNTGGNMWPMLAGVGPILGEETAGYFIYPDGTSNVWRYTLGKAELDGSAIITVPSPYSLITPSPKVAVLWDHATASSGEAMVVAFVGRPKTRSFGTSTCGLSTANAGFGLSDGGMLYLTTSVMADRDKNKKGGPVPPDVVVEGDQEVIDKAVEWLNEP